MTPIGIYKFLPFCLHLLACKPSSVLVKEEPDWLHTLYAVTCECWWKYCSLTQLPTCTTGVPCLTHIHHSYTGLPGGAVTTPAEIPCWTFNALLLHVELPVRASRGCCNGIILHCWHPSLAGGGQAILEKRPVFSLLVALLRSEVALTVIQNKQTCMQFSVVLGSLRLSHTL